jgi:transcriptional regulator GlxA family with amidase domain
MIDVTVLVFDGGHASTSVCPIEIFGDAGALWNVWTGREPEPLFRVRTAGVSGAPVTPHGAYGVLPERCIDEVERTDLVFVPSTGLALDEFLDANRSVIPWLETQHRAGARIAAVCAGVALLGEAGLLDGRTATTHWGLVDEYRRRYPLAIWRPDVMVTEHENIYTGAGVYAALDLALYLVEKLAGHLHAVQTARSLLVDMPRMCQTRFAITPVGRAHADSLVRRAEDRLHALYATDFSLEALARELGMSPRNFVRRFRDATGEAPRAYVQKLRVAAARHMLEQQDLTVQAVCAAVGYDDVSFFRDVFKRHTGETPAAYREKLGSLRARQLSGQVSQ